MEPSTEHEQAVPMICASELSKRDGRRQAVSGLGFTVGAGQICALLGPNGAGETALATALTLAGLPAAVAFSAVLLHRLLTFWLPVLPGWAAFTCLMRKRLL
ncbi:hypothetical protein [Streptomyces guryensis]|uniref:Uncharacterized protein n=1 Tax=Streptomyces guryensis TaxID=2886947 RepID=A0A9Q3ZBJ3_9ACTN|nr:hypothetical protein [Streptomyces guryensis]MCD9876450.1 hypothetical protein [Streptomyces guryensis]